MKSRQLGVSPKLIAAVVTAVITYVLGQTVLELPGVVFVVGQAVLVAIAAFTAPAGTVVPEGVPGSAVKPDRVR